MWVLILFCVAINLDVLFAAFAYGMKGIRLSASNILTIIVIDCTMLAISLLVGGLLYSVVAEKIMTIVGAVVLIALGVYNITMSIIKWKVKEDDKTSIFVDVTNADKDKNKILSLKETVLLAVVLGMDALMSGFAYGFGLTYSLIALVIMCVLLGISLVVGSTLGMRLHKKSIADLSWIGGIILILIAVWRLIGI
ncbi:MAG: manganese efflux pump [Christensenellaceae bacterium]|jgi:putative sporulation protein YtaF|nr:manganese efflux pump [Christensenellaceae bacterium]